MSRVKNSLQWMWCLAVTLREKGTLSNFHSNSSSYTDYLKQLLSVFKIYIFIYLFMKWEVKLYFCFQFFLFMLLTTCNIAWIIMPICIFKLLLMFIQSKFTEVNLLGQKLKVNVLLLDIAKILFSLKCEWAPNTHTFTHRICCPIV